MTAFITCTDLGDGVAVLWLSRPQERNALTMPMMRDLSALLDRVAVDRDCRVLVLAADGPGFCAGLDLKQVIFGEEAPRGAADALLLQELYAGTVLKLHRLPQPVVAAVQGAAVGAGFGLALAADIRVASPDAAFHVGAVKIGLSAGECGISFHLPRLIGAGRAFEIMLTGRPVSAEEAVRIGLVTDMVPADALFDRALTTARSIAGLAPYSIRQTKQVMWGNLAAPNCAAAMALENHVQVVGLLTDDFREGATAFAEKRSPRFTGC